MDMDNKKYQRIYDWKKRCVKRFELQVNMEKHREAYEKLISVPSRQSYIIELVERDIGLKKENSNKELEKKYGKEI